MQLPDLGILDFGVLDTMSMLNAPAILASDWHELLTLASSSATAFSTFALQGLGELSGFVVPS